MLFVVRVASLRCVVAFYVVASIAQGRFSASHISFEEQRGATGKNLLRLNTTQVSYQPHHSKLNYSRCTKAVPRYSSIDGKLLDRRHDKFLPDHSVFWPKINLGPCSTTTKISSPYPGTRRKGWRTDNGRRSRRSELKNLIGLSDMWSAHEERTGSKYEFKGSAALILVLRFGIERGSISKHLLNHPRWWLLPTWTLDGGFHFFPSLLNHYIFCN